MYPEATGLPRAATAEKGSQMRFTKCIFLISLASLFILGHPDASLALFSGDFHGQWNLIGKLKAETTFRTRSTPDNNPIPIEAWDMTSQRNLLFLEFRHDLGDVTKWLELSYYLQGRVFYDGVWDYGPSIFSSDRERAKYLLDNRDQINDLKWDADLFIGYLDMTSGPFFMRVGRQVMSWGEMSTLRVMDAINPTDNSSLAVDLLERLVPLFMVRTNMAFDNVGPFDSVSIQGYYVPGAIDNTSGEDIIDGSPMLPPIGRDKPGDFLSTLKLVSDVVDDDLTSDRYGVKLGLMFKGLDLSFAYFRTYSDQPVPNLDISAFQPVYLNFRTFPFGSFGQPDFLLSALNWALGNQKLKVLLDVEPVDVYGGSFNYYLSKIDTVVRGEVAFYKNVPKMTAGSVPALAEGLAQKIFIPGIGSLAPIVPLLPPSLTELVLPFSTGTVATFDVLKYGLGFDKWMKIPPLNREDFMFILEYVGTWTTDYRKNTILKPWYEPNDDVIYETEFSNTFVLITNTNYFNGNLTPQLVAMFEVEPRALSLIPSVRYEWRKFQFEASYFFTVSDNYNGNLGMLETRDEVSLSVTLNF